MCFRHVEQTTRLADHVRLVFQRRCPNEEKRRKKSKTRRYRDRDAIRSEGASCVNESKGNSRCLGSRASEGTRAFRWADSPWLAIPVSGSNSEALKDVSLDMLSACRNNLFSRLFPSTDQLMLVSGCLGFNAMLRYLPGSVGTARWGAVSCSRWGSKMLSVCRCRCRSG